jgi:hypothetical protein
MKYKRYLSDTIILSTVPHFLALFYTKDDTYYSSLVILSCLSSILWHETHETSKILFFIDYFFAFSLVYYELKENQNQKMLVLSINFLTLFSNKFADLLSYFGILKYNKGHSVYHLISSWKTIYIAYLNQNRN